MSEIDSLYFNKSYCVLPKEEANLKAYHLLREALSLSNKVGLAKITMRNKEHICLIRAYRNGLILTILYYPSELTDIEKLLEEQGLNQIKELKEEELDLAKKLVNVSTQKFSDFVLSHFTDSYKSILENYLKAKVENREFKIPIKEEVSQAKDLMLALKESVEKVKKKRLKVID